MKCTVIVLRSAALGIAMLLAGAPAIACPDGYYEQCVNVGGLNIIKQCVCLPNSGTVVNTVTRPFTEASAAAAGTALEGWLNASRNTSITGAQPIPAGIRLSLQGYIEDDILNRARFKIGDAGVFNAAGMLLQYGNINGDVSAVTLVDVIVFRNASDAFNSPKLWAHELTHVRQFRDWGTHDFAVSYVRNWHSVEDPAYGAADNFVNWQQSRFSQPQAAFLPQPFLSGQQQQMGMFCLVPQGRFGPGPIQPVGNMCFVDFPFGRMFGQIVP